MRLLKTNKLAFIVALFVGLLYLVPHLAFIYSLGSNYKGIPMMPSANEVEYVYRIHDILDGDYLLGSPLYYEYKKQMPMMLPIGEYFYALPALLFKIPLANVLIASKFILPVIIFLLVYFLVQRLIDNPTTLPGKISSIAAGVFITLGYDLIDYHTIWLLLKGQGDVLASFAFIWARPVNPTIGAVFLLAFLITICALWQRTARRRGSIVLAALWLTIMFGNYFFSWGLAMSILAVLALFALVNKRYDQVKNFVLIPLLWLVFSAPYWWMIWQAKKSPWYQESVLRHGLFLTHYPLINKFLVLVLIAYVLAVFVPRWRRSGLKINPTPPLAAGYLGGFFMSRVGSADNILSKALHPRSLLRGIRANIIKLQSWHWFALAMLAGSFLAYNQQIITGRTVWPFHFVQYSIPVGIIILILLLNNEIKPRLRLLWAVPITLIITASVTYGVAAQTIAYPRIAHYYAGFQPYSTVLNWLDQTKGDCVVLIDFNNTVWHDLTALVGAFSHCDVYARDWHFSMLPLERSIDDYMIQLRWQGVRAADIDNYIKQNEGEAVGYLFSNWKRLFNVQQFPDVQDLEVAKRIKEFPEEYKKYMKLDLPTALKKYRLDYILSVGPLKPETLNQLNGLRPVFESNGLFVYSF